MTNERQIDAIYQAKAQGSSDEEIMKRFSVGIREIERAVLHNTGTNLNLFVSTQPITTVIPRGFKIESTCVWSFKSRGKWATHNGNYRGNWSPYIPRNIILRYSSLGDLVFDPFCGGGTTAVEAKLLGRKCIARDINPAAIALTNQNLNFKIDVEEIHNEAYHISEFYDPIVEVGDALNLRGIENHSIDLICTHPPYANIINYTNGLSGDISFHDADLFIGDMRIVAKECIRVLKPGGVCAVLIGDTRQKKHVVPIGFRTMEVFLSRGFILKDLIIKRQHNCRTDGFWYSSSVKHNFLLLAQEYLPVFIKPMSKKKKTEIVGSDEIMFTVNENPIIPQPEKMECKTTWVFPKEKFNEMTDANLLNRYSNGGNILQIENVDKQQISVDELSANYDLIYCKLWFGNPNRSNYTNQVRNILEKIGSLVKPDGHLIIRTKDVKIDDETICPALKIWRILEKDFKIREIIIIALEPSPIEQNQTEELDITHEYLLVYRKLSVNTQ